MDSIGTKGRRIVEKPPIGDVVKMGLPGLREEVIVSGTGGTPVWWLVRPEEEMPKLRPNNGSRRSWEHRFMTGVFAGVAVVGCGVFAWALPGPQADEDMETIGGAACLECHSDIQDSRVGSQHGQVDCESCHGPLAKHAREPDSHQPVVVGAEVCLMCHEAGMGMPASFPTVNPKDHNPQKACTACHPSHHPEDGENKGRRK